MNATNDKPIPATCDYPTNCGWRTDGQGCTNLACRQMNVHAVRDFLFNMTARQARAAIAKPGAA